MEIRFRQSTSDDSGKAHPVHRCPQCGVEALVLKRRHVSSPGWGEQTVTEYYDCDYCDARYSYSPSTKTWKLLAQ